MDLRLNELQELIRDNAQEFLEREAPPDRIREIQIAGEPDPALWRQMTELGWCGLPISEEYGGQDASLVDFGVLLEQMCRHALLSPFQQTMLAAVIVQKHASDEVKASVLPRIVDGLIVSPALKEGHAELRGPLETEYDGATVTGDKRFVEYAATADLHLVAATRDGVPGLALVPRDQTGVSLTPLQSFGDTPQADVSYEGAAVEGWIEGAEAVEDLRHLGSAITAFECYAHAQKGLDMAVEYVQIRVQFGRPIGTFEAVQNHCANMATLVEASRFLTYELLYDFDEGRLDAAQVARVKAITSRTVTESTMWSHIMHGGIGFMEEYDLQFHTRRGKEAALRWGDPRESLSATADALLD